MRISDWSSDVCSSDLPLESVPAVETQTLRSRIGQTDVLDRHARDAPCEIRRIDAAVEHACKPVQRRIRIAAAHGFMQRRDLVVEILALLVKAAQPAANPLFAQIGRASWRERVCQYRSLAVGSGA